MGLHTLHKVYQPSCRLTGRLARFCLLCTRPCLEAAISIGNPMPSWSLETESCHWFLQVPESDAEHMSAKSGVACGAIAQLTQLQRLLLGYLTAVADADLMRLSALSKLTSLEIYVLDRRHLTGSWLAAVAAAHLPLRELHLCSGGVRAGKPMLRLAYPLCSSCLHSLASWCSRSRYHAAVKQNV